MSKSVKILILEDSPDDVALIERTLRKENFSFESVCVDSQEDFIDALTTQNPDVVLSDHGLPEFNSIEALKITQQYKNLTPFILVTGTVSEEFAVNCLKRGADDYVLKTNLARLPSSIIRALKEKRLEALRREARRSLRKQNQELLKVNTELDSFVYSVSHNLRAPLASVMGLLNLCKLQDKDMQLEDLHDRMYTSITKLDETLKEILNISRNVRSDLNNVEIRWSKILEEAFHKLYYLERAQMIKREITISGQGAFATDKNRLEIILNNLLSNSIRYSKPTNDAFIRISVSYDQQFAEIKIEDNGIGIDQKYIPRIYDMFYRATELSDGAGLGLYVVKEMVAKLRGEINIDSQIGIGTLVSVKLPNAYDAQTSTAESPQMRHAQVNAG